MISRRPGRSVLVRRSTAMIGLPGVWCMTGLAAIALLAAVPPFAGLGHGAQAARTARTAHAAATACRMARGPFHVVGTKVIDAKGRVFVPYGITVPGLANVGYRTLITLDDAKIRATASFWCANTVRLPVAQDLLVGPSGRGFSLRFLRAVEHEVTVAEKNHLVVVLNAQTEDVGNQPAPTSATARFWTDLSRVYGHDPQVIFDLFNQPRIATQARCGDAQDWNIWRNGGLVAGHRYLGMQELVRDVRADGARNLLWVEGPCFANSLSGLGSHRIKGRNIVYAFQHPRGAHNPAQWYTDFGWVVFLRVGPVVDAEWTNYAAVKSECWPDAPTAVPAFLRYLGRRGIGLTAYQLKKGLLIRSANLADPTHIYSSGPRRWRCANGLDEGAGADLLAWFRHQNG